MSKAPDLVPDDFSKLTEPLVVRVRAGDREIGVSLQVDSVDPLPPHRMRALPFSLVLRGPRVPALQQGSHALIHPRLGTIDVFLVPIAEDAQSRRYEATFN